MNKPNDSSSMNNFTINTYINRILIALKHLILNKNVFLAPKGLVCENIILIY